MSLQGEAEAIQQNNNIAFDKECPLNFHDCKAVSNEIEFELHRESKQQVFTKITDKTKLNNPSPLKKGMG